MGKATKIFLSVMLVVGILAASILLTPWVPVGDGLWSPLDVLTYEDADLEDFLQGNVQVQPATGDGVPDRAPIPELLRAEISTMEQAREYFDARYPNLWQDLYWTEDNLDYFWMEDGGAICSRLKSEDLDRPDLVHAVTYLLSDDIEIYTVIGFQHNSKQVDLTGTPMLAINCIKTEDGYEFIDPVKGMQGDLGSRYGAILPEAKVSSIEEYVDLITSDPGIYSMLDFLYMFEGGERIEYYVDAQGICTLRYPMQKSVYQNLDKDMAYAQLEAKAHIKPENVTYFQLSQILGGTTLTPEEANDLVYAKPEVIQEKVKTAGDVLMYMMAAQIGETDSCKHDQWGEYVWHTNLTAKEVMEQKVAVCGSCANLANYLLEGDYEEVGFFQHAFYKGNGGGHVYNYILHEGKYYVVDFSWYMFAQYVPSNDFPVQVLDTLEEFDGERVKKIFGNQVSLLIAFTSTGQHLPNIFGEDYNEDPYHYYVPEGAEYTVLYEAGDGYLIAEKPLDKKYHDWTAYWPGYQAP